MVVSSAILILALVYLPPVSPSGPLAPLTDLIGMMVSTHIVGVREWDLTDGNI